MTRVAVATAFGGPEVIAIVDEQLAEPAAGQVLVEVKAIGVNPIDYKLYSGAFGSDVSTLPLHLGNEASGVVVAVGDAAQGRGGPVSVGDEVIVKGVGGVYAEKVLVPAAAVVPKPAELDWESAAGLLGGAGTAVDTLETVGIAAGDTVLVHGAAGGVGSIVVQLARARGARVIGTARAINHDALREYGAEPVEYGPGLIDRIREVAPDGIDAAIDAVGTDEAIDVSLELLSDTSRLVTIAAFGRAATDGFPSVGGANPQSVERRSNAALSLIAQAAAGEFTVTIAKTFPLSDAAKAHAELQSEHPRGKFVLIP